MSSTVLPPPAAASVPGPGSTGPKPVLDPSVKRQMKKKNLSDFWRATAFLKPYWKIIMISGISAFFVGLAMAGSLGTMLPILRVLINGDTVPGWANRQIVEGRLKVNFSQDAGDLRIVHITSTEGPAATAGLKIGDSLTSDDGATKPSDVLIALADPATTSLVVHPSTTRAVTLANLPPIKWYWARARPIIQHFPTGPISSVASVLVVVVFISAFGQFFRFFQEYYSDKAAILAIDDIRRRMYDHVLHVPMTFFGRRGTSDVTSRLVGDCQSLQDGFKNLLGQSIQMPINALLAFGLAITISWKLTLFIVFFAPVMVGIIKKFGKKMRRASRRAMQSSSSMLGQIEGTLNGIRVVKGSNAERFERRRYARIMRALTGEQLHMSRIDAVSSPTMELLVLMVVCVVVIWATNLVQVRHELKPEQFFVIMACLATIAESLRRFGKLNNTLQKSGAAAARVFETINEPVERPRQNSTKLERPRIKLPSVSQSITFENITFTYPNAAQPALVNLSLSVKQGESVAIVGRNGSGKTTLLALLPRFYDPQEGRITIDGINTRDGTLKSLRDQISIVTQDSVIFPGTIAANIAYGHPMATRLHEDTPATRDLRKQIESAAKRAYAHDFILEKPQGYDTLLGELGGSLSGGQKQRINIARAILRATPILVLDEATSQVDAESEHLIQKAIEELIHERTTFVIAHRFSTIMSADRIIVMDRGQIVGAGKHDELLKTCPTYVQLYERQLGA